MVDNEPPDWSLMERVAAGHATEGQRAAVEQWIGGDPERRALFELVRRIVAGTRDSAAPTFDADAALARARIRLGLPSAATPSSVSPSVSSSVSSSVPPSVPPSVPSLPMAVRPARQRPARRPMAAPGAPGIWRQAALAAGIVLAVALGVTLSTSRPVAPVPGRTFVTSRGERASVLLRDGTRVALAPATRLTVPSTFDAGHRTVALEGEAFFSVVHDARAPFTVRAGNVVATDVGTSFDVRAYAGDRTVAVAVRDGRVSLAAPATSRARPVSLGAGDLATVTRDTVLAVAHGADVTELSAWTGGRLVFRATPLRDVVTAVARWYDADLAVGDPSLGSVPVTASFEDERLDDVALVLARAVDARVARRGSTLLIVPTGSRP